ncbi:DeoR/GlpR family DNA-binding transcription regulator [Sulfitobacter sp. LCG007]
MQSRRQASILRLLQDTGAQSIAALADRLGVSSETVRRDIRALAETGEVQRVHGGASLPETQGEAPFRRRMRANAAGKQAIAQRLAATVRNGDSLMLDTGTTTSFVARALTGHSRLTVITNSTDVARILSSGGGNRVLLAGGQLRPDSGAVLGEEATAFIQRHAAHIAVISAGALMAGEVMDFDPSEAGLARAMLSRCDRRVLVTDTTKFEKRGLVTVCRYDELHEIVTDGDVSASERRAIGDAGVTLVVAAAGPEAERQPEETLSPERPHPAPDSQTG